MPADSLARLAAHAGRPIAHTRAVRHRLPSGTNGDQLYALLDLVNGFYAFHRALHVFPDVPADGSGEIGLTAWNAATYWRADFPTLDPAAFFFAEDVFGVQFAILHERIMTFDPETGESEPVADDIEDWAEAVQYDGAMLTGWPIAQDWSAANGSIPYGTRLVPKVPFVSGGDYSVSNLYAADAMTAVRARRAVHGRPV